MALNEVIVTSKHTYTIEDKHLGIKYVFKPNEKVQLPMSAANHFFGIQEDDKSMAWKRRGFTNAEKGMDWLKKFNIKVVEMVPKESVLDDSSSPLAGDADTPKPKSQKYT